MRERERERRGMIEKNKWRNKTRIQWTKMSKFGSNDSNDDSIHYNNSNDSILTWCNFSNLPNQTNKSKLKQIKAK